MRLLNTRTGQFVDCVDASAIPSYAILSHVWDKTEQVYQELKEIQKDYDEEGYRKQPVPIPHTSVPTPGWWSGVVTFINRIFGIGAAGDPLVQTFPKFPTSIWEDTRLSPKVRDACAAARAEGLDFIWIDSCCINKESSSELSEAINSMYRWYARSHRCYTFLADVPDMGEEDLYEKQSSFRKSKWFTRGWTLQELIAPEDVIFMSSRWNVLGSKYSLADLVESITGVEVAVLIHDKPLDGVSVATRMSWAALRETTRVEDRAYSLFGIFGVNMSTLYGEGSLAFRRLQLKILKQIPDQSIFAWARDDCKPYLRPLPLQRSDQTNSSHGDISLVSFRAYNEETSLFADSPKEFSHSGCIRPIPHHTHRRQLTRLGAIYKDHVQYYTSTPHGIRTEFPLLDIRACLPPKIVRDVEPEDAQWCLAILGCISSDQGEEHILARVCYVPSSQSDLQFLLPGYLGLEQLDSARVYPDIVMLRYSQVEQFLPHLAVKTIYLPHPKHTQQSAFGLVDFRSIPDDVHIIPPRWAGTRLEAQGYAFTISQPFADGPRSCRLTLSKGGEAIHIHCWGEKPDRSGNMWVCAEASITTVAAPSASDDLPTSSDSTWFFAWTRQSVLNVDATIAGRTMRFGVVLKHTSKSRLFVYAKIPDAVPESDGDDDGQGEIRTSQGTRESKVTIHWEPIRY